MPLPTRLGARIEVALAPNFQKTQKMRQETRWKMQVKGRSNQDFPSSKTYSILLSAQAGKQSSLDLPS
jgi:hypothetical protein